MRNTHQHGFTLVESLIAIVVLALLLLAAVPTIGNWVSNARIRGMSGSLQSGLQLARNEALRRNQNVSFNLVSLGDSGVMDNQCQLSGTSGSWVVSVDAPTSHCDKAPGSNAAPFVLAKQAAGQSNAQVRVHGLQSDGETAATTITFNGFGRMVPNPAGTASIARIDVLGPDDNAVYRNLRILISGAGGVRSCDPLVTENDDPRKCPESAS